METEKEKRKKTIGMILGAVFIAVIAYLYVRELKKTDPDNNILGSVGILLIAGAGYAYLNSSNKAPVIS